MNRRSLIPAICVIVALLLSACATNPNDPVKDGQYVSLVSSLSWTNPLTGKRDGSRSSWPVKTLQGHDEAYPLAQIRQCDQAGKACAWGVMRAHRKVAKVAYGPAGVTVELALAIDIDRRQEVHQADFNAAMAIPSDIPALRFRKELKQTFTLSYGKVQHIDLEYGLSFDLCALRYDAVGRALDRCEIPYI